MRLATACAALAMAAAWASAGVVAARTPVVVYDGPSDSSTPRYLLGGGYPLVVISETTDWLTVCMHDGTNGYVPRRDTRPGDNVVVVSATVVRSEPNPDAAVVLNAAPLLLLTTTGDIFSGWLPVRHDGGQTGFVPATDVWGHSQC